MNTLKQLGQLGSLRNCVLFASGMCLLLFSLRVYGAISFREPLQVTTSGVEADALFSIWKCTHQQTVFTSPFNVPYTASTYNWLFYYFYGVSARVIMAIGHLNDPWLPTVCRLITLMLAIGVAGAFWQLVGLCRLWPSDTDWVLKVGYSILAVFNPLFGFWLISVRPDICATLLEICGVVLAVKYINTMKMRWLYLSIIIFYFAWACKQSVILAITTLSLWLLANKRGREVTAVVMITLALYVCTFAVGGQHYMECVVLWQTLSGTAVKAAVTILATAVAKAPFVLLMVPAAIYVLAHFRTLRKSDQTATCLIAWSFCISLIGASLACFKAGASDNYLFMPALLGSVLLVGCLEKISLSHWACAYTSSGLRIAMLAQLAAIVLVLTGQRGIIQAEGPDTTQLFSMASQLGEMDGPAIVLDDGMSNLPWFQPHEPNFVNDFVQPILWESHAMLLKEAKGGVPQLIEQGYFGTIVVGKNGATRGFDARQLFGYKLVCEDAWYRYFARTTSEGARLEYRPFAACPPMALKVHLDQ